MREYAALLVDGELVTHPGSRLTVIDTVGAGDSYTAAMAIGLLFTICGAILMLTGLVQHVLVLGINVNLWWGLVLLIFGLLMLYLAARARRVAKRA